jgi:hypothetical protein
VVFKYERRVTEEQGDKRMSKNELAYHHLSSFSLMLHGWPERFPVENLLPVIEQYFALANVVPQEGHVQGLAPPELKSYSMKTIRKRISEGTIHGLVSLGAYHFVDREYKSSHDYFIDCGMTYGNELVQFINAVSPEIDRRAIALNFLRDLLTFVTPCYGYSLEMPLGDDPALFAVGAFAATDDIEEETFSWQQSSNALFGGNAHKQGRMRHVFEINILSRPHMEAQIDGRTFGEWVRGPNRGTIEEWKSGVWVWQVPKEQRLRIAAILHFNGILTAPDGFQNRLIG